MAKARISLASADINQLNEICEAIKDIAGKTKVKLAGPITLPTKKLKLTTRKAPDGEGKASWERYEMRIHKRLIDLGVDERALRLVMRVPIPEDVNIEIAMLD
ncbi:MAG: 30S ribosomal protein S10 [Nanoarchaeota archaeon]|nr:30S ribosomal protein S10 [Nanoarchaeota archaeon]|tara:strand:- start:67 stop:375 length:309 start_codon:yes stop_codon:yes gene_type:complete